MTHLGTLEGKGALSAAEGTLGDVDYCIEVARNGGDKDGQGTLSADAETLYGAVEANICTLELEDGQAIDIIITEYHSDGPAKVITTGPVPYF